MDRSLTWIRTRRLARKTKVRLKPSSSSKDSARQPFSVHSSTAAGMVKEKTTFPTPTHNHLAISEPPTGIKSLPNPARAAHTTCQEARLPFQSSALNYEEGKPLISSVSADLSDTGHISWFQGLNYISKLKTCLIMNKIPSGRIVRVSCFEQNMGTERKRSLESSKAQDKGYSFVPPET